MEAVQVEELTSGASGRIIPVFKNLRRSVFSYDAFRRLIIFVRSVFLWIVLLLFRYRLSAPSPPSSPSAAAAAAAAGKRRKFALQRDEEDTLRRRALAESLEMVPAIADGEGSLRCEWNTFLFFGTRRNALFCRSWFPDSGELKGIMIIIHGLNEHGGRYAHFARQLNSCNFGVYAMDWIGHGGSDGLHGYVPSLDHVVMDTAAFLEKVKLENPGVPCFLFGHSTGGAVVLKASSQPSIEKMVEGVILTSPALRVKPAHPIVGAVAPFFSLVAPRYQFKGSHKVNFHRLHFYLRNCRFDCRKKKKENNVCYQKTMPEETTAIDYVMEAASGPHFSGLRLDGLLSAASSPRSSNQTPTAFASSFTPPDFSGHKQPFVIGVSGGTASGKTTVCDMIIQQLHDHRVVLVNQDSFYRGLNSEELKRVHEYNFDHPDAFDTEQLLECVEKLKAGQSVQVPIYDFKSHQRCSDSFRQVNASDVIILEGILVFHDSRVRNLMNMKIFVDTDADVRLARRIRRDTVERGRDLNSVLEQYAKFVKPAFDDFVLPSKKYADVIIPRGGDNHVAIDLIVQHIRTKLGQHDLCKIYPNVYVINSTFQIRGMHTLIRDRDISKHDFVFYSDRLIRLVVENGLGHLPFTEKQVVTPTESVYTGVDFCKKLCGVSIVRSGESMENALRACCKGIKIGKILIHRDGDNGKQLIYEKLPKDISERHVLLLDPVLATGNSANQAIELLIQKGVPEAHILFLNLISAPEGIHCVCKRFPSLKIITSEIDLAINEEFRVVPGMGEFGDRYFGTDDD